MILNEKIMTLVKLIDVNLSKKNQLSKEEFSFLYFTKSINLDKLTEYTKQAEDSANKSV